MAMLFHASANPKEQESFKLIQKGSTLLALALSASLLVACGGGGSSTTTDNGTSDTSGSDTSGSDTSGGDTSGERTFTQFDAEGGDVTAGIESAACVKDSSTGLTWEVKTDEGAGEDPTFRDKDYGYFWFDGTNGVEGFPAADAASANLFSGNPCQESGTELTKCDTGSYIAAVNAMELCGLSSWRLPTSAELKNLIDQSKTAAPYSFTALGNTASDPEPAELVRGYWSSNPSTLPEKVDTNRLAVSFSGKDDAREQDHPMGNLINNYIRLVHD